ncbi:MAG: hypothetical protein ACRCYP_02100 [Alphaproteobacteria bacterium]
MSKRQATDSVLRIKHSAQRLMDEVTTAINVSTEQLQTLYQIATQIERAEKQFKAGFRKWEEGELAPQERPTIVNGVSID